MKGRTLILCLLTLTACEPVTHYNRIEVASLTGAPTKIPSKERGQVKPYGSVKLYQSKEEVPQKYKTIAIMSLEGDAGDEARFITAFLYRAADLGADGVIFYREGAVAGLKGGGGWFNGSGFMSAETKAHGVYRAEAITFETAP